MTACPSCGAEVAWVYDPDDELIAIDAGIAAEGDVSLDGGISGHRVAPGLGSHRAHRCEDAEQAAPARAEAR